MISIIIPFYNKVKSITQTLNCVMQQSYQDFEVVVVDDSSTDGSIDVVHKFLDERSVLFPNQMEEFHLQETWASKRLSTIT